MRKVTRLLPLITVAVAVVCAAPALAFHDGGVAHCNSCHTMHNSEDGLPRTTQPYGTGFDDLLLYGNPSDVCLACHNGTNNRYDVWADDVLVPNLEYGAGDFVFLEEDELYDGYRGNVLGHEGGHSIISGINGTVADPLNSVAPGGAYPANEMHCTSCHDPHGTSAFRLLYMDGQTTTYMGGSITWNTLEADPIPTDGSNPEADDNHNAYLSGYSEWCGQCHGLFHQAGGDELHPSGEDMDTWQVAVYNSYRGTTDCVAKPPTGPGDPCGDGTNVDAYLALVPFQDPDMTTTSTLGPDTLNSQVVCVSCHRAHASSAPNAGRWDFNVTGLEEDGDSSGSLALPNPYDAAQRSLCNKCHAQDEYDDPISF